MKKLIPILMLFYTLLHALDTETTLNVYQGIFGALVPKKKIAVYTNSKEYKEVFRHSDHIVLSDNPLETDIVLVTEERMLMDVLNVHTSNKKKPYIFVTKFNFLKLSDKPVGAFYWRKGRSQLVFIKNRLNTEGIVLPQEYKKFTIDDLK